MFFAGILNFRNLLHAKPDTLPQGIIHDTLTLEPLLKVSIKEREITPYIAPRTDTHVDDTGKET